MENLKALYEKRANIYNQMKDVIEDAKKANERGEEVPQRLLQAGNRKQQAEGGACKLESRRAGL